MTLRIDPRPVSRSSLSAYLLFIATWLFASSAVTAQTTDWKGGTGEWAVDSNWTNGEPTATKTARIMSAALVSVTEANEACRSLYIGADVPSGSLGVSITGGSLSVSDTLHVGRDTGEGVVIQINGDVTAGTVVIGDMSTVGAYSMSGGSLSCGDVQVGTDSFGSSGLLGIIVGDPTVTVSGTLRVGVLGAVIVDAGTLTVGTGITGGFLLSGFFEVGNAAAVSTARYEMTGTSQFLAVISGADHAPVVSAGPAILDGTLVINDGAVPDGTYELIRGNPLSGTFDIVSLPPSGNWSWRIEGNSLLATKGTVPVQPTTWSRLKLGTVGAD